MKRFNRYKQHKWVGIVAVVFIVLFCLSGIVLNHRAAVSGVNVSRSLLPPWYKYERWSGGLFRGTIPHSDSILIYGSGGVYLSDSLGRSVRDFNCGLPAGADCRAIRAVVHMADSTLVAVGNFGVYALRGERWVEVPIAARERLSDATVRGDSLIVVGRSHLFVTKSLSGAPSWTVVTLPAAVGESPRVSLFRTVWKLHSGELFGVVGRVVVDCVGLVLIVLCVTGVVFFFRRKTLKLHNAVGRWTIVLTLFVAATGFCLRPPLLIPLVLVKTTPIVSGDNAWEDKLRALRYDAVYGDYLLYTSDGFFSLEGDSFEDARLSRISDAPRVSVMGLTAFEAEGDKWVVGSFDGCYRWRRSGVRDGLHYASRVETMKGEAVSGFSSDFPKRVIATYSRGTLEVHQPDELSELPMSLWGVALELHSGRLLFGSAATWFYVFLFGGAALWVLITGWKVRRK